MTDPAHQTLAPGARKSRAIPLATSPRRTSSPCEPISTSIKDYCFVYVAEDAPVEVPAHGPREHHALKVAATRDQIFHLVPMRDAGYILFDDRTVVQHLRHVVAGGSDQLDSPRMRRVIRPRTRERRQKRVMHIDDARRIVPHEGRRENLHIARQH